MHKFEFLIFFTVSLVITGAFLKLYIDKISKTAFFRREENIDSNKKSCIKELHKHKSATPTMGGIAINLSLFISSLLYWIVYGTIPWFSVFLLLFGVMGFIDDYIKIKKIRDGVTPKEKLAGLIIISAVMIVFLILNGEISGIMRIPFIGTEISINIVVYAVIAVLLIVAASNSVNITDGLDGLAVGICAVIFIVIGVYAYALQAYDVLTGCAVMEGACLAMLWFNKYPAKIFMGDTGSLLLGAAIAVFLIKLNMSLWIILMLGVCFFETFSVVLQLFSLKVFNKRIFKIAPFHHHLEKCGWKELTIVFVFWSITIVLCIISLFTKI